jgi:hypothetical protein
MEKMRPCNLLIILVVTKPEPPIFHVAAATTLDELDPPGRHSGLS